jgi:hypothetical protein
MMSARNQFSKAFTSSPFPSRRERRQHHGLAVAVVVSGSWAGCCAGFFVVKTSEELRIKIGPGADGFQTNIGQLSDNSRTQNQLTTLEVRRAVSNAPCYVRPLPWQGEQRPASNQASFGHRCVIASSNQMTFLPAAFAAHHGFFPSSRYGRFRTA